VLVGVVVVVVVVVPYQSPSADAMRVGIVIVGIVHHLLTLAAPPGGTPSAAAHEGDGSGRAGSLLLLL